MEAQMRRLYWSLPALLVSVLVTPLSATERLPELARAYIAGYAVASGHVPSFARQTGLACSACHYQFLTLTPFGRKFKLNGYTLTNLNVITEKDSTNGGRLGLTPIPLVSGMLQSSLTHLSDD